MYKASELLYLAVAASHVLVAMGAKAWLPPASQALQPQHSCSENSKEVAKRRSEHLVHLYTPTRQRWVGFLLVTRQHPALAQQQQSQACWPLSSLMHAEEERSNLTSKANDLADLLREPLLSPKRRPSSASTASENGSPPLKKVT